MEKETVAVSIFDQNLNEWEENKFTAFKPESHRLRWTSEIKYY